MLVGVVVVVAVNKVIHTADANNSRDATKVAVNRWLAVVATQVAKLHRPADAQRAMSV